MSNYVITTDSNSDVPSAFLSLHPLTIIPQYYAFGDMVYGDELHMPPSEFYETMRKGQLPKSMANNPAVIREKLEAILKEGKDILHIAFSSALSGSCSNVQMVAKELLEEYPAQKILIFDSLNASLGEGLSVMRAVALWEEGMDMETLYDTLEKERKHIRVAFTVDDLHHLQRGGRVSKTTAMIGSMVNIKPVLSVSLDGTLQPCGTVRGRKKSLTSLVKNMEESLDLEHFGKDRAVGIVHGDCLTDAQFVETMVRNLGFTHIYINEVSPSIGTHAGPGVVGLMFYGKEI